MGLFKEKLETAGLHGSEEQPQKKVYSDEEKINYCMRLLHSLYGVTEITLHVTYNDGEDAANFNWKRNGY